MGARRRARAFGLVALLAAACGGPPAEDAGPEPDAGFDAGLEAGFWPACEAVSPCVPPEGFNRLDYHSTAALPAAFYDEGAGCMWVLFELDAGGRVAVESAARGPGWSLVPPADFACDPETETCRLDDAPEGILRFSGTSCGGGRSCSASGSLGFDLDLTAQLVSLGYGFDTSSCPTDCARCE